MDYRRLGRTDLHVSAIGLGTMTWGEQNSEAEAHAQMDHAVDRGINLLDSAELYPIPPKAETQGRTEEIIGSWLKARGNRDTMIVASKIVGRSWNDWFRDGGKTTDLSRAQVFEAVDKSLRRLGTDYIDLYQIHWPDRAVSGFGSVPTVFRPIADKDVPPEVPIEETLSALDDVVKAGKVRHIGLSNESPWGTMTCLALSETRGLPRVQSIQNAYSLVNRTFETGLAEIAMRENTGLLAYSPLAQGSLTGKYLDGALPAGARKTLFNRMQRYETPGADIAVAAYVALAREFGLDPAQMAIRFAVSRPFVTSVLIGATTMAQLQTDIDAFEVELAPELEERIDAIHLLHQNPCP
ncbi:NADP(H)-dependent aldo-keto reductase [Microbaculum marinisediminis]|uniref:Protein tas n=1 Tax=Microbaculum marinisediminis TaxID=2931392 RepID=A0AAW5R1B0_9HYPH|nr:NADP(H)-dependent aldo-keto reductase [Microbaculum sp. A6E488]MCT8972305.1 NADP(H)-dependent aldo-keto reductase [Microbaculum sp. A6E488]